MTAKESKAVAWRYRDRYEAEADVWNYLDLPPLMTYDYVEPLVLQSALHAAEAELREIRSESSAWCAAAMQEADARKTAEAELGELRKTLADEVARGDSWRDRFDTDTTTFVKLRALADSWANDPRDNPDANELHATELRQLLASDGGADGDNGVRQQLKDARYDAGF